MPDDKSLMNQNGSSFGSFSSTVTRKRADGVSYFANNLLVVQNLKMALKKANI